MCMYVCIYIYIYIYIHLRIYYYMCKSYIYICIYTHLNVYIYIYMADDGGQRDPCRLLRRRLRGAAYYDITTSYNNMSMYVL